MIYNPFDDNDEGGGTVFRDVIMLALMGFVVIVVLLLPHINPKRSQEVIINPPGNVIVEIQWPYESDTDVDLWVQGPGDVPVGYSNKGGRLFNLLRDDLGNQSDVTKINYENSFSRGIIRGEYIVNIHLYRHMGGPLPVEVVVVVSVKKSLGQPTKQILTRTVSLERVGQEITVFRFDLDKSGKLDKASVHDIYKALRSNKSSSSSN